MDKRTLPNEILLEEAATLLNEGRDVVLTPRGSSMLPFIRGDRDTVTLRRLPRVAVGDIILVRLTRESRYVLHRVIALDGEHITLMGDGNIRGTESCTTADVLGTVVAIHKPSGRTVKPGKGRLWYKLLPARRWILAFYHRWLRCGNILRAIRRRLRI